MLGMLGNLTKAVVGVAVETPASLVADVLTLGGALNDKPQPHTAESLAKVMANLQKSTK